jgi:hypothetical protein
MIKFALAAIMIVTAAAPASAQWQRYREDPDIAASFDIATFAPFRNNPSVWVRWNYASPKNGVGGMKIQFMADCQAQKLYEIAANPYDGDGNYLAPEQYFDAPKEFPVTSGSLNEATYKLLCH